MKKSLFIAFFAIIASSAAFAQAKVNLYNVKGTKIELASSNGSTQVLYALSTGELQFSDKSKAGTWMQNGTGAADTDFVLAWGKNEVVNRNVNLDMWTGSYNSTTGKGTAKRFSASAQMGTTAKVTITPLP
jgi:hypothetical protein